MTDKVSETSIPMMHHAGTANGATSVLIWLPEYELSISTLTNKTDHISDLFDIVHGFASTFIKNLSRDD